jgi:hypothetical protein
MSLILVIFTTRKNSFADYVYVVCCVCSAQKTSPHVFCVQQQAAGARASDAAMPLERQNVQQHDRSISYFEAKARETKNSCSYNIIYTVLGLWISVDQLFFCDEDIHSQSKYLHEL